MENKNSNEMIKYSDMSNQPQQFTFADCVIKMRLSGLSEKEAKEKCNISENQ